MRIGVILKIIFLSLLQAKLCVDTLCKYLDNICENPADEKYRKIRKTNKAFMDRVASCEGHDHFLSAIGFDSQVIDDQVRQERANKRFMFVIVMMNLVAFAGLLDSSW